MAIVLLPQCSKRFIDRRRMMCKIVDHGHASLNAAHLHSAFNRFEGIERFLSFFLGNSPRVGRNDNREAIQYIKVAEKVRLKLAPWLALAKYFEPRLVAHK